MSDVHVASSDYDHVQLVWLENDGSSTRVATSWGNPQTNRWHGTTYLSPASAQAAELRVSLNGGGLPPTDGAAWTESGNGGGSRIMVARWRRAGWATPLQMTSGAASAATPLPIFILWGSEVTSGVAWLEPTQDGGVVDVRGYDAATPMTLVALHRPDWLSPVARLSWRSVDDWSSVWSVQVRIKTARRADPAWTTTVRRVTATAASEVVTMREDTSYCVDVRGVDAVGHLEAWHVPFLPGAVPCVSTPTDDRQLTRSTGWRRVHRSGFLDGSALRSTRAGSTVSLRVVRSSDQRILVTKGPHEGSIRISCAGLHRVVSLRSPTYRRRAWVASGFQGYHLTGILTVTVVSRGGPVRIDGVLSVRRLGY